MDIRIHPCKLEGTISAIPSKSQAHRILICAAFSDKQTTIICQETNDDIEATADCLRQLGAKIIRTSNGYTVTPVTTIPNTATMRCRESGSTLRFLLPIVAALGVDTTFHMEGRLPYRPLSPLWEELGRMGCELTRPSEHTVRCHGKLSAGIYRIDGGVSSQFISGLLFALALLTEDSRLEISGKMESAPYVAMTQAALELFGIDTKQFHIAGNRQFISPGLVTVEGDWSNSAFFFAANCLGSKIYIENLDFNSVQGDRAVVDILNNMHDMREIDAANIPDLVPILSIAAASANGAVFTDIRRLRIKESDRVQSVANILENLGCNVEIAENQLTVHSGEFKSCTIDSAGDHRIAMSAAIAATIANGPVTILGAECVAKSYPKFWDDFRKLGGNYEQYIR